MTKAACKNGDSQLFLKAFFLARCVGVGVCVYIEVLASVQPRMLSIL